LKAAIPKKRPVEHDTRNAAPLIGEIARKCPVRELLHNPGNADANQDADYRLHRR